MIPLRFTETERDGFDEPVVEIWRDDDFVGMVFWDDDVAVVQIFPDDDGDVLDLPLGELTRVLDLAEQIVTPEEFRLAPPGLDVGAPEVDGNGSDWSDEHPATLALVGEFDPLAETRSEDGEGFFQREIALEFVRRCDELDLAVVEVEGFDFEGGELHARPNLLLNVSFPGVNDWAVFRPAANALVNETVGGWPPRQSLVVAFVVQQPDGETFVA